MVDITGVNSSNLQPNRVTDRSSTRSSSSSSSGTTGSSSTGDRIEISSGARQASSLRSLVQTAQAEPDVRPEAVAQARERLESGGYQGAEVSREAAKKILGFE